MNLQWLQLAQLCLGLFVGLFLGYQLNLEKSAQIMAAKDCGICQANLNTMIGNFNNLSMQCSQPSYKDLPTFISNQTVRVYAT